MKMARYSEPGQTPPLVAPPTSARELPARMSGVCPKKRQIARCYLKGQNCSYLWLTALPDPYHLARNFNPFRVGPWEGTRWYLKGHPCREVKRKRNPRQTSLSDIRFCVQASRSPSRNGQRWRFPCFAPCAHMVRRSSAGAHSCDAGEHRRAMTLHTQTTARSSQCMACG